MIAILRMLIYGSLEIGCPDDAGGARHVCCSAPGFVGGGSTFRAHLPGHPSPDLRARLLSCARHHLQRPNAAYRPGPLLVRTLDDPSIGRSTGSMVLASLPEGTQRLSRTGTADGATCSTATGST